MLWERFFVEICCSCGILSKYGLCHKMLNLLSETREPVRGSLRLHHLLNEFWFYAASDCEISRDGP